jgi:3-dehydroquinate dehydratase-2
VEKILIIHGPNLNLLGEREPEIYGSLSLDKIDKRMVIIGDDLDLEVKTFQSNSEGEIIDAIHDARLWAKGIIINAGAYTHTSIAIHDAVAGVDIPVIEVHLSNIYSREQFRRHSIIAPACVGSISGFGWRSYELALMVLSGINQGI